MPDIDMALQEDTASSLARNAPAFTDELEQLCKRHGVWPTGLTFTNPLLIRDGDGIRLEYACQSTDAGEVLAIYARNE